jgi:hypothetical protein
MLRLAGGAVPNNVIADGRQSSADPAVKKEPVAEKVSEFRLQLDAFVCAPRTSRAAGGISVLTRISRRP